MTVNNERFAKANPDNREIMIPIQCPMCHSKVILSMTFWRGDGQLEPIMQGKCNEHTYRFQFFSVGLTEDKAVANVADRK